MSLRDPEFRASFDAFVATIRRPKIEVAEDKVCPRRCRIIVLSSQPPLPPPAASNSGFALPSSIRERRLAE